MEGKDLYRDTWVRYLGMLYWHFIKQSHFLVNITNNEPKNNSGYANEIGESLRHYIGHRNVMITYGVSTAYCFADTIDKTAKCYRVCCISEGKSFHVTT